jgi:hypothetical protein
MLPWYPAMTVDLTRSADDLVDSVDRARAAVSTSADSVHLASDFLSALNRLDTTKGDIPAKEMPAVTASMNAALTAWDQAAKFALDASNEMYEAQARSLSTQITMEGLESSPQRYGTYRDALQFRFPGVAVPDYQGMLASGATPGELGCAAWLAYETKKPLARILSDERSTGASAVDLARRAGLFGESMEIAEGLLLQDYTEKPSDVK